MARFGSFRRYRTTENGTDADTLNSIPQINQSTQWRMNVKIKTRGKAGIASAAFSWISRFATSGRTDNPVSRNCSYR
jgi:hypothetical protein